MLEHELTVSSVTWLFS